MKRLIAATCLASLAVATLVATSSAAAVPVFQGTVGPGFTIKLAKKPTKAGKVKIVVADRSSRSDEEPISEVMKMPASKQRGR